MQTLAGPVNGALGATMLSQDGVDSTIQGTPGVQAPVVRCFTRLTCIGC